MANETEEKPEEEKPEDSTTEPEPKTKAKKSFTTKDGKVVSFGDDAKKAGKSLMQWLAGNVGDKDE